MGERDFSVGVVASIQTHGSLANLHPPLHLLVTDGGFRRDGTFVCMPLHDVTTLTEAFRRAVLRLFVRRDLMDVETAHTMLAWRTRDFTCMTGSGSQPTIRTEEPARPKVKTRKITPVYFSPDFFAMGLPGTSFPLSKVRIDHATSSHS